MLIPLLDPETERRNGKETGAGTAGKELADVKAHFVLAGFDSRSCDDGMIEHAVRAKPPFRDPRRRWFKSHDLDTQALRRTPAGDIDRMNGNSAGHLFSCVLDPNA